MNASASTSKPIESSNAAFARSTLGRFQMLFQKKVPPKSPADLRGDCLARIDGAIADWIHSGRVDLRDLADALEGRADSLRLRWATTAPVI
jgi:hypothetical protein